MEIFVADRRQKYVVKQIIVCFVLVIPTYLGYVYFLMVSNWLTLQITAYIREGINQLSLSAYDVHDFCVGVRIFCRNSVKQVGAISTIFKPSHL
jgi:hypothetical protein